MKQDILPTLFYAWLALSAVCVLLGGGLAWITKRAVERALKSGHTGEGR